MTRTVTLVGQRIHVVEHEGRYIYLVPGLTFGTPAPQPDTQPR